MTISRRILYSHDAPVGKANATMTLVWYKPGRSCLTLRKFTLQYTLRPWVSLFIGYCYFMHFKYISHHTKYRICSIRRRGYYVFHHAILCGFYSRAAFIKLSGICKIFCKCKGFEKSQFYKINKELRCGDLVLKQNFQLLDQPSLSYKAVPTRHLQSVSSFP